jgi:hypothetical protein
MSSSVGKLVAPVLCAVAIACVADAAAALPLANGLALKNAAPGAVEAVQWRRGWRGPGWGGVAAGFMAGAIIGSAMTAPYGYYGGPYPYAYGGPYYYPAYRGVVADDAVAYCMQRFRSYDPRSGTYLGYDGYRHPCPYKGSGRGRNARRAAQRPPFVLVRGASRAASVKRVAAPAGAAESL